MINEFMQLKKKKNLFSVIKLIINFNRIYKFFVIKFQNFIYLFIFCIILICSNTLALIIYSILVISIGIGTFYYVLRNFFLRILTIISLQVIEIFSSLIAEYSILILRLIFLLYSLMDWIIITCYLAIFIQIDFYSEISLFIVYNNFYACVLDALIAIRTSVIIILIFEFSSLLFGTLINRLILDFCKQLVQFCYTIFIIKWSRFLNIKLLLWYSYARKKTALIIKWYQKNINREFTDEEAFICGMFFVIGFLWGIVTFGFFYIYFTIF